MKSVTKMNIAELRAEIARVDALKVSTIGQLEQKNKFLYFLNRILKEKA